MISLARTLLTRPSLLLMDEPTSAMDSQTEALFLEHLKRATEGQTLVVVTHRPSILSLVDRIIVVDGGKIMADGPKANVLAALNRGAPETEAEPAKDAPRAERPARPSGMRLQRGSNAAPTVAARETR